MTAKLDGKPRFFLYISLILISFVTCLFIYSKNYSERARVSQEIRAKFKDQLKALPPPPFKKVLKHIPTKAEANLGRLLFNDPILSRNNDVSCATCHLTNHGFADGNRLNFGTLGKGGPTGKNVGQKWGTGKLSIDRSCSDDGFGFYCDDPMFRNTLSTVNVIYRAQPRIDSGLLWDGRFGRLNFQVLLPIHTKEEMCGVNPIPAKNNPFKKGGPLFDEPITVSHSHFFNIKTGIQVFSFNSPPQKIRSVESLRENKNITYPARNECLAIAVSKVKKVPYYRKQFKKIYKSEVTDILIGKALASFVSTHIANKSPYDSFVAGKNALSVKQLKGMAIFMTPVGEVVEVQGESIKGAGCAYCHSPPFFGGSKFSALGVKGDDRSSLSRPNIASREGGFAINVQSTHGELPSCHISQVSVSLNSASPDIGRAIATSDVRDCFKFRSPVLRNVIETYPYFHHGTGTGLNTSSPYQVNYLTNKDFKEVSLYALQAAIEYHLRGPIDLNRANAIDPLTVLFDPLFQIDPLVSPLLLQFGPEESRSSYPVKLEQAYLEALVDFVAFGLYDEQAMKRGYLNNPVGHPSRVPSGFLPTITRDRGLQTELPPNAKF